MTSESLERDLRGIAEDVERELDEHGWTKYSFERPSGEICLSAAFQRVMRARGSSLKCIYHDVLALIRELFPERNVWQIMALNDHPATTREDISLVLKHLGELDG